MKKKSTKNIRLVPVKGKKDAYPWISLAILVCEYVVVIAVLLSSIFRLSSNNQKLWLENDRLGSQLSLSYLKQSEYKDSYLCEESRNDTLTAYIQADATKKYEDVSEDLEILCQMTGDTKLMPLVYSDTNMLANITAIKDRLDAMSDIYTKNSNKGNGFDQYLSLIRQIEAKYDNLIEMSDILQEAGASLPKAEKPMITVDASGMNNIDIEHGPDYNGSNPPSTIPNDIYAYSDGTNIIICDSNGRNITVP